MKKYASQKNTAFVKINTECETIAWLQVEDPFAETLWMVLDKGLPQSLL